MPQACELGYVGKLVDSYVHCIVDRSYQQKKGTYSDIMQILKIEKEIVKSNTYA